LKKTRGEFDANFFRRVPLGLWFNRLQEVEHFSHCLTSRLHEMPGAWRT